MLAIKFQRVGKKRQPGYRIVVAEKRSKLAGPPVEQVGFYNPLTKEAKIEKEKVEYWIKTGAKPTASVHNLFVKHGVISGPKIAVKIKSAAPAGGVSAPEEGSGAGEVAAVAEQTKEAIETSTEAAESSAEQEQSVQEKEQGGGEEAAIGVALDKQSPQETSGAAGEKPVEAPAA